MVYINSKLLDIIQYGYNLYGIYTDKIIKLHHKIYGYTLKEYISFFKNKNFIIDDNEYIDIFNRKLKKIYINKFYGLSTNLKDKLFGFNEVNSIYYLKEHNLEYSNDINDYRIWYWDIEVSIGKNIEDNTPDNPIEPIITISWYDTINKKYYIIGWHNEETKGIEKYKFEERKENNENIIYIYVKNEFQLLKLFISILHKYKPIMIIGWFSNFFDMSYLIKRLEVNNIPTSKLSLINKNVRLFKKHNNTDWMVNIPGLYSIELNKMIERYISDKFSSMSLNNVSKKLGIGEKNEINLSTDYKYNFYKFMKYNIQDVRLTKKIDEIYNITGLMIYLHNLTGVAFDKILSTSNIVKSAIIKYSKEIVVDRKLKFKNYQGAIVLTPKYQGILKNVCTLDANSMYPTSIITFNISPDTYITSYDEIERNKERIIEFIKNEISIIVKKELKLPNILTSNVSPLQYILKTLKFNNIDYIDTGYSDKLNEHGYIFMHHNYKIGIFAQYLKEVYDERVKIKNKMKKYDPESLEYKKYNAINSALKLILVSTYGANGYAQFFLYDPRIAETITYFARKLLTYGIKFLNEIQYEIQYGDTDSLFVLLHTKEDDYNKCLNEANKINIEINSNIYKYHTSNYISTKLPLKYNNYLGFKLEHILHYIYFSDSKKRYFGIEYPDENGKERPYVRGMNVIRKDAPKIIKQILNELVYKILKENITKNDFNNILNKVKSADLKEIGIIKSFNKKFTNYKVLPQHVKAARFANEAFNVRISNFDHPYMFYIKLKHTNKKYKYYDGVIALNQDDLKLLKNNNIIEIDYDKLIEKQILDQLKEFKYVKGLEDIISVLRYKNKHSKYISLFDF